MAIPKEPRQLMINIMYLVLMALLALNVSAEVMSAFITLDKGNENSIETVDEQMGTTVSALEDLLEDESKAKYQPILPAIAAVQSEVENYMTYVEGLRDEIRDQSGNADGVFDEGDYSDKGEGNRVLTGLKNKDVTTRILVLGDDGEGGDPGKGFELKERTEQTRARLIEIYTGLLDEYGEEFDRTPEQIETLKQSVAQNMPFGIDDEEWRQSDKKSWVDYKFGHMPVAAVLPLMSQMQSDLKVSEANLINSMAELAGGRQITFDKFFPVFAADKSYVIGGERLNATVSVGSYSSSLQPENIELRVNGQRLNINDDGTADFSTVASGNPGPRTLKTYVKVTNPITGEETEQEGEFTYEVGSRSVAVSADKMNVFYMGVDNPITVSASGVPSSAVRVNFEGGISGTSTGANSYMVRGSEMRSQNNPARVRVTANGENLGSFDFRVKRIPDPVPVVGGQKGGDIANSTFRAQRGLIAQLENFDFDARCNISGFQILYSPAREDPLLATNAGASFTGQAAALVNRAKPGDNYIFKNIKAKCPGDGIPRDLGTMAFTIR